MKISTAAFLFLGLNLCAQPPQGSFSEVGSLTTVRTGHTATLLANGKVLISGGYATLAGWPVWSSAELYDPAEEGFSLTGSMGTPRCRHTATLLPDGRVLIVGGSTQINPPAYPGVASAEIYDPSTSAFTPTGSMASPRYSHTATLLNSGKVLIAGGIGPNFGDLSSAELYDPSTGTFSPAGNMTAPRDGHLAVPLADGRLLIEGGGDCDLAPNPEVYDPSSGAFTLTGASTQPYLFPMTATLLPDGTVYTTMNVPCDIGNGAESYNPSTGVFTPATQLPQAMVGDTANLLPEGQIFIHGAQFDYYQAGGSFLLYDPVASAYTYLSGAFAQSDEGHSSTLLSDGTVLMAGGWICCGFSVADAEVYLPLNPVKSPLLYSMPGGTQGAILHGLTQQLVSSSNPAAAGEVIEIYGAGLAEGSLIPPQVWIGGLGAPVTFFGDAPGYPGLNQINAVVPGGLASGSTANVRLDYLSRPSNTVTVAIQ